MEWLGMGDGEMTPKPPPGFEMVGQPASSSPPPPPGFEMIGGDQGFSFELPQVEQPKSLAQRFDALVSGNAAETAPDFYGRDFEQKSAPTEIGRLKNAAATLPETMFGTDQELAAKTAAQTEGAQAVTDDNGNPMVQLPDGSRYYVNQPGLDSHDFLRFGAQAAPYLPGGIIAGGLKSLGARMLGQGATAGATNIAGQMSVRDQIDPTEAVSAAAFGSGAELGAPIMRGAINLFRKVTGMGQAPGTAGRAFAKELGYADNLPNEKYIEIEKKLEAGVDPATVVGDLKYGLQYTKGQMTGDKQQLAMEEPLYQLSDSLKGVVDQNQAAVKNQISQFPKQFSGEGAPVSPGDAMQRIQGTVQQQAKAAKSEYTAAYNEAGDKTAFSTSTVKDLGNAIKQDLRANKVAVHPSGTPKAYEALQMLEGEINKIPSDAVGVKVNAAERMGRLLSGKVGEASRSGNKTDLRAAQAVKKSYDEWFSKVTDDALVRGDKNAVDALRRGRSTFADFSKRFTGDGSDKQVDAFIQKMVSGKDAPQELLNASLGMSQVSKPAAYKFVNRLKMATKDNPQVINDMKSAHVMQLLTDKAGNPLSYGDIVRNVNIMERQNPELIKTLYGNDWTKVRQFSQALEPLLAKGDMKRTSGTAERTLRYLQQMAQSTPIFGDYIKAYRAVRGNNAGMDVLKAPALPMPKTNRLVTSGAAAYGSSPNQ